MVTGSDDTWLRCWNAATGEETRKLTDHEARILALTFRSSGKVLVSVGLDGVINQWSTETWQEQGGLRSTWVAAFAGARARDGPSGQNLLAVDGSNSQSVELWDLSTETDKPRLKLLPKNRTPPSRPWRLHPGTARLLATGYSGGQIYACGTWPGERNSPTSRATNWAMPPLATFAPDGRTLGLDRLRQQGREPLGEVPTGRPLTILHAGPQLDHHEHGLFSRR